MIEERELLEERELDETPIVVGEHLTGYALKFNVLSHPIHKDGVPEFREVILPEAFDLQGRVSFQFRHDDLSEYGDTETRTLTLTKDDVGIRFDLQLPPYAKTLRRYVAEKIVKGMSIGFRALTAEMRDGIRYIKKGELVHIAAIINPPAYPGTSVELTVKDRADVYRRKMVMANLK